MGSMNSETKNLYDSEGYARFDSFYATDYIDGLNSIIDDMISDGTVRIGETVFDEDKTGKIKQIQYLHRLDPEFQRVVDDLRPIAEALTGSSNLTLLNVQLFEKHIDISKPTRSHQDNAYFKMEPASALTFWLSLDDIDEENGCLYYAPKTHLTPTRKHQRYHPHTTFRVRSGVPGLSLCLHEHPEETDLPMHTSKGDLLVHNCNLVHRAGKNSSVNRRRRAIGLVFIPTECEESSRLVEYHNERLREDIELQKIKNPTKYRNLKKRFAYLFENA
jgi:phytanoyl-CoA hydroxylase